MIITTPNLPKKPVTRVIIGEKYAELIQPLAKIGIKTLLLPDISEVSPYLSGHTDLAVLQLSDEIYLAGRAGESIQNQLETLGFRTKIITGLGEKYPSDAILNACKIGDFIIHRQEISAVKNYQNFIDVKQGYSKCNICVLRDDVIITSDVSIERACRAHGFDVLKIEAGHIDLEGFDTGFIGGATFMISQNTLAFTGTISHHPSYENIMSFLDKHQIEAVYLSSKPIFDIGSAVLLTY